MALLYHMGNIYSPSVAYQAYEATCDLGYSTAFSLQDDYRPGMTGLRFYKEAGESKFVRMICSINRACVARIYAAAYGQFCLRSRACLPECPQTSLSLGRYLASLEVMSD